MGHEIVNTVEDVTKTGTAIPFQIVGDMPCFESRQTVPQSTPRMDAGAGCGKGAEDELVCWESQMVGDTFHITKTDKLFDRTRVAFNGRASPTILNRSGDALTEERIKWNRLLCRKKSAEEVEEVGVGKK